VVILLFLTYYLLQL